MRKIIESNKTAATEIIVSVSLILIAISALSIISIFVKKQASLSPQFSCADIKFNPPITIKKACFNASSGDTEITLSRISNSEIKEINLITQNSQESGKYAIGENCESGEMLAQGETRTYLISGNFQSLSLKISNCVIESVKIEKC